MPKIRPVKGQEEPPVNEEEIVNQQEELEALSSESPELQREEDPTDVLRQQIADLKKSEEIQRNLAVQATRDREDALRRAKERDEELSRLRVESTKSKQDAIDSAIAAAKAEAEKAEQDMENAAGIGDVKAQIEATRRLARAENSLARLEDGKEALAREPEKKPEPSNSVEGIIENSNLPSTAKSWLRSHPEYISDPEKNAEINYLHHKIKREGHTEYSPAYYDALDEALGFKKKAPLAQESEEDDGENRQETRRSSIVSAPVSREVPSNNGARTNERPRLTELQREAAKNAGISEVEYAKQLIKLNQLKSTGEYGGQR